MDRDLYQAIVRGNLNVLGKSEQVHLFQKTLGESTTLHVAVQFKRMDSAEVILDRCPSLIWSVDLNGDTALHLAAKLGVSEIVKLLIENAKRHNDHDAENGRTNGVEKLIRMTNKENDTALHKAVRSHHYEVVKLLTEADLEFEYFANNAAETPLYLAAEQGLIDIVKQIVETCPSSIDSGPHRLNALHAAVLSNNSDVTKLLLDKRPNSMSEANENGLTPLDCAAYLGFEERVVQLLEFDSSVFHFNRNGDTALHIAASEGYVGVVKKILQYCPQSWELRNKIGQNFLHVAAIQKQDKVVDYILESDLIVESLVNEPDDNGNTPLHLAVTSDDYLTITSLMKDSRLNKHAMNKENKTAFDIENEMDMTDRLKKVGGFKCFRKQVIEGKRTRKKSFYNPWWDEKLQFMKDESNTQMVVATLIATFTFTAGISLPGGYQSDGKNEGMASLSKITSFRAFVISNTIAMLLSIYAVLVNFWIRSLYDTDMIHDNVSKAYKTIVFAMMAMVVAFMTGSYAVLSNSIGLAIAVCVICSTFYLFLWSLFVKWCKQVFKVFS